ncbi:protein dalmatian [Drosophila ficusphila]|uniref:protein dalmatian n=1 Tax=Drosophila ficusphila TaxID=30025 RepID=UPI0007E8607B|nr:protein dalmatian [Drosophila ficusphila]
MVKKRAAPDIGGSDIKTATRPHRLRGKKLSEKDILAAITEPQVSLRKCVVKIKRLKLQESQNVQHDVDTSSFEPPRNSTMYVNSKVQNKMKENVAGPRIKPFRVRLKSVSPTKPTPEVSSSKPSRFFHRYQPPTRTRSSVTRNVFDFLSESQIEDDIREDPAADIIQRLVKDGKACVMVRSTKSGKTRAKPIKRKIRPVGRRRKVSLKDLEPERVKMVPQVKEVRMTKPSCALSPIYEPEDESSNDADPGFAAPFEVPVQVHDQPSTSKQAHDGAYSNLARSVMLNQTQAQNPKNLKDRRRELINMARQLVSTPINRKAPPVPEANVTNAAISPITRQSLSAGSPAGAASPWRVSDKSPLPSTFMFGFNTSQLPSYSSDHMRRRHVYLPDVQTEQSEEPAQEESICPALHEQSNGSNANDSNEENRPPVATTDKNNTLNDQENAENAENFVHLPNPRKTLQNRQPFKDINILEVVILPSWKKNVQNTPSKENTPNKVPSNPTVTASPAQRSQTRANLFGFDEILPCEDNSRNTMEPQNVTNSPSKGVTPNRVSSNFMAAASTPNRSPTRTNLFACEQNQPSIPRKSTAPRARTSQNLFGFEEFITENENVESSSTILSQNETLHDKLHRLAELRPTELPEISSAPICGDSLGEWQAKQRDIRDVFCSTMICNPAIPKRKVAPAAEESIGLFKESEAEPEITFDEKQPRRTYVKERPQRKRKKRVQILYIESESEDESEQDSHDKSSPLKKQPHKRPRRDIEHEAKLQDFITSFNKECEEVEKFPVIIE